MKTWNELSIRDKNDIIRVAVQNGITALPDIREKYNEFADGGPTISDEEYQGRIRQVAQENWRNWGYRNEEEAYQDQMNNPTYDYRSFYANNPSAVNNAETHWPDTYKGALHRTFSDESIYNGKVNPTYNPSGVKGGRWTEKGYIPHGGQFAVPFNMLGEGGKIHIKPSKKGTFTVAASRHGMGVQAFASKVLAHKENYSTAMVKKANFARNASKWHGNGGHLFLDGGESQSAMLAEQRQEDIDWIDNWLHNRVPQMANNLDAYYNPKYEDFSKRGFGYSDSVKMVNATDPHSILPPLMYPVLSIGAEHPGVYKYLPFAERGRQNAAKRMIDTQVSMLRNNMRIADLRDPAVFETLNNNDPYVLDFLTRHNRDKQLTAKGTMYGAGDMDGINTVIVSPFTDNPDTFLHEAVHSATHQYPIQNSAIEKILDENRNNVFTPGVSYDANMLDYLKKPTEVYSRLMEFRRRNNLDPHYKVTKDDLNRWRQDPNVDKKKLIDVFSNDVLLKLFNDVTHNNTLQDFRRQFANQASFGGPIVEYAMGGRLKH